MLSGVRCAFLTFYLVIVTLTRAEKKNKRSKKKKKKTTSREKKKRATFFFFFFSNLFPSNEKNSKKKNSFRLGRQEDAHEYLVALLDAMHEACLSRAFPRQRPPENASSLSPPPRFLRPPPPALAATTLVHALFGGLLRSQIRCLRCGHESNTYEPCVDVSLDVAADEEGSGGGSGGHSPHRFHRHHHHHQQHHLHKKLQQHFHQSFHLSSHASPPAATTLQGALSRFTAGERLEGENAYACPGCREEKKNGGRDGGGGGGGGAGGKKKGQSVSSSSPPRSPAVKTITLHSTPRVLVLQLKRFEYHAAGRKISRKVDFGTELDVAPFTSAAADAKKKSKSSSKQQQQQQQHGGPRENGSSKKRKAEEEQDDGGGGGPHDPPPPPPAASAGPDQTRFALCGVLVHSGHSVSSGHYTCFVRAGSGLWHGCDDDHVSQVSERVVLAQRAYILFYVRSGEAGEAERRGGEGSEEGEAVGGERLGNGGDVSSAAAAAAAASRAADNPVPPPVPSLLPNGKPLAERQRGVAQGKAGEGGGNDKAPSPAKR